MLQEMLAKYDLVRLQNHPANVGQDHLTICGFFKTEAEFAAHAEKLRENVYQSIPRVDVREAERATDYDSRPDRNALILGAFDHMEHLDKRELLERKSAVERAARQRL